MTNHAWRKGLMCAFASVLALAMVACGGNGQGASESATSAAATTKAAPVTVRVASMKGPTSIGLVGLMEDAKAGKTENGYEFTVSGAADEVATALIKGNVDIATVPANVAATLYNKTEGGIKVVDVNTLGVLYVVSTDTGIKSVADLAGKTVYMTGKGQTPDCVFQILLKKAGVADKVKVEYKSEATEVVSALAADPSAVALLPQPFATAAQAKVEGAKAVVDLNDAWSELVNDGSQIVTGVTVVRTAFADENPAAVGEFLACHKASAEFANNEPANAAQFVADYGIIDNAKVVEKAIPNCHVTCLSGNEMKQALLGYYTALNEADPSLVGGQIPDNDFYWVE